MSYYEDISQRDVISKLTPLLDNGTFYLRDDGKLTRQSRLSHNTPWIHHKQARNRNCTLYHTLHSHFGFIHSTCHECWKTVVRPRTLVELHSLMNIQKVLDLPSKCGIEKRETVCGLYGGYFYANSLAEGKAQYKCVRKTVDEISVDIPVILKRGCTEFEVGGTPSDHWEISEDQKKMEYLVNDLVDQNVSKIPQPEHLKESIFRTWIHWAYAAGDLTYLSYTDGKALFAPYKTYHEVCNGKKERQKERQEEGKCGFEGG